MLKGDRVRLRRIEPADLPRFVAWLNDPEVRQHLALVYPMSQRQEEAWFEEQQKAEPAAQPFAIEARQERGGGEPEWVLVGATGFHVVDWRNRWAELGIFLGDKSRWGDGLGTEATRVLVRWAFEILNLNRVFLRVGADNARAIRCYEKVGFKSEGRLRQDRFQNGRYVDTVMMGLLREELPAND
jgi:RimJ/RimL family protein N-acetyltransferase